MKLTCHKPRTMIQRFLLFLLLPFWVSAQNTNFIDPQPVEIPESINQLADKEVQSLDQKLHQVFASLFSTITTHHLRYNSDPSILTIKHALQYSYAQKFGAVFFKNKKSVKKIYKTLLPILQAEFAKMSKTEQRAYREIIEQSLSFLNDFDLEQEQELIKKLEAEDKSYVLHRGRWNAFIYRRIANEQISQKDGIYWLKRLKKDLAKVADGPDFYIQRKLEGAFFLGRIYSQGDQMQIFEYDGQSYKIPEGLEKEKLVSHQASWDQRPIFYKMNDQAYYVVYQKADSSFVAYVLKKGTPPQVLLNSPDLAPLEFKKFKKIDKNCWLINEENALVQNQAGNYEMQALESPLAFTQDFYYQRTATENQLFGWKGETPQNIVKVFYDKRQAILLTQNQKLYHKAYDKAAISTQLSGSVQNVDFLGGEGAVVELENGKKIYLHYDQINNYANRKIVQQPVASDYQYQKVSFILPLVPSSAFSASSIEQPSWRPPKSETCVNNPSACSDWFLLQIQTEADLADNYFILFYEKEQQKWGLLDQSAKLILAPEYEKIELIQHPQNEQVYIRFKRYPDRSQQKMYPDDEALYGLMTVEGKLIFSAKYRFLEPLLLKGDQPLWVTSTSTSSTSFASLSNHYALLDENAKLVYSKKIISIQYFKGVEACFLNTALNPEQFEALLVNPNLHPILKKPLVAEAIVEEEVAFDESSFEESVIERKSYSLYIDHQKGEDYFIYAEKNKMGVYSLTGKQLIPNKWDEIKRTDHPELFEVKLKDRWGLLSKQNRLLLAAQHEKLALYPIQTGKNPWMAVAAYPQIDQDKKFSLFDHQLKQVNMDFDSEMAKDTIIAFDPDTFEELVEIRNKQAPYFELNPSKDALILSKNGKKGILDLSTKKWQALNYENVSFSAHPQYLLIKGQKGYGVISRAGQLLIPTQYQELDIFPPSFRPLAFLAHKQQGALEILDLQKGSILKGQIEDIYFDNDLSVCFIKTPETKNYQMYDANFKATGKSFEAFEIAVFVFDPETFEERVENKTMRPGTLQNKAAQSLVLQQEGKLGLYSFTGKELLAPRYDEILHYDEPSQKQFAAVRKAKKWAVYNYQKQKLGAFVYDKLRLNRGNQLEGLKDGSWRIIK